jgi:hypothetical protein
VIRMLSSSAHVRDDEVTTDLVDAAQTLVHFHPGLCLADSISKVLSAAHGRFYDGDFGHSRSAANC